MTNNAIELDQQKLIRYRIALEDVIRRLREPGPMSEFSKGQALAWLKTIAPDVFSELVGGSHECPALVDETADFRSREASERRITEWDRIVLALASEALTCAQVCRLVYGDSDKKTYSGTHYILLRMNEYSMVKQNKSKYWELAEEGQKRLQELVPGETKT